MTVHASARLLTGRRIVGFDSNPWDDGRGGTAHSPRMVLDNGARLTFLTEETDQGEFGTCVLYHPPQKG